MSKSTNRRSTFLAVLLVLCIALVWAQAALAQLQQAVTEEQISNDNVPAGEEAAEAAAGGETSGHLDLSVAVAVPFPGPGRSGTTVTCVAAHPGQVTRYLVSCTAPATQIDVRIADCCISGDHWEAKHKIWDNNNNTVATTSPGPASVRGLLSRVYSYGTTAFGRPILAVVECKYLHGINFFPAGSFIDIFSNAGSCTVTNLGTTDEIYRSN